MSQVVFEKKLISIFIIIVTDWVHLLASYHMNWIRTWLSSDYIRHADINMQDLYGIQTQLVITTNQEEERHSESVLPTSGSSPPPNTNNQSKFL